jgi:lycopene beta-cyclase
VPQNFDYIIIGSGLAGLQLAYEFGNDPFFQQLKIAIIDPSSKESNDKTWCFWEKGIGKWDSIITSSWDQGKFISTNSDILMDLKPYSYKMLRSLNFYRFVKSDLEDKSNFHFSTGFIFGVIPIFFGKTESLEASAAIFGVGVLIKDWPHCLRIVCSLFLPAHTHYTPLLHLHTSLHTTQLYLLFGSL